MRTSRIGCRRLPPVSCDAGKEHQFHSIVVRQRECPSIHLSPYFVCPSGVPGVLNYTTKPRLFHSLRDCVSLMPSPVASKCKEALAAPH